MNIYQLCHDYFLDGGIILVSLMTLIQIAPIKINPWSRLASGIGKFLNRDLETEVVTLKTAIEEIKKNINLLSEQIQKIEAVAARSRIMRFGDEVSHKQNHSKEHFMQIFADMTQYDQYCNSHPDFKNHLIKITSEQIQEDFKERDKTDSFL